MPTSTEPAGEFVERFSATERWLHWALAVPFLVAFASGLGLFFPELAKIAGNRELVRNVHRFAGIASVLLPVVALGAGNRTSVAADTREVDLWTATDRAWLRAWARRKVGGRDTLPPQGRFNAGQKVNAILTVAALFWLAVSGVLIFPGLRPPFFLVENARALHNLTWILLTPVLAGHIFLSAIYPPTRPGLGGILSGRVRRSWLEHHHPLSPELRRP